MASLDCEIKFAFFVLQICAHLTIHETWYALRLKRVDAVIKEMNTTLSSYLPAEFGITFDGWSHKSEHYVGVFAAFEHGKKAETVLVAMTLLIQEEDEDPSYSAARHAIFLSSVLADVQGT